MVMCELEGVVDDRVSRASIDTERLNCSCLGVGSVEIGIAVEYVAKFRR
jgi:hypothetical protein